MKYNAKKNAIIHKILVVMAVVGQAQVAQANGCGLGSVVHKKKQMRFAAV